jgi:hypothetical protein
MGFSRFHRMHKFKLNNSMRVRLFLAAIIFLGADLSLGNTRKMGRGFVNNR